MKAILLGAALLLLSSDANALPPDKVLWKFELQTWRSTSGLPQNTVNAIQQTRDGFLWLGTDGGLARFDGLEFRVFDTSNTPQLRSNSIQSLMEDNAGTLWISTTGGLVSMRDGQFTAYSTANGLPSNSVLASFAMRDGRVLAATVGGAAILTAGRFQAISSATPLSGAENPLIFHHGDQVWVASDQRLVSLNLVSGSVSSPIAITEVGELQAISVTDAGDIWLGGSRGLEILSHDQKTNFSARRDLPSQNVTALLADGAGGMWIGTREGLALYTHGAIQQIGKEVLAGARVQKLFLDRTNSLWVSTNRGPARVTNGNDVSTLENSTLDNVLSILEDREGNMWFGTDTSGLSVLRDQALSAITKQDGLSANSVRTVFQDRGGNIWLGTNGGGLDQLPAGQFTVVHNASVLSSQVVLSLAQTAEGLWVGTPDGLNLIANGRTRVFTTSDGLTDDFVRSLFADTDGSLWIGTRHGLSHFVHGSFTSYSRMDGLGSDMIGSIIRGPGGDLWVATAGGLSRRKGDEFVNFSTAAGLPEAAVTVVCADGDGTLWIGTNGGGLIRWHDGAFLKFPPAGTGLPDTIYALLLDSAGNLWISSRNGIDRVSKDALGSYTAKRSNTVTFKNYGSADGTLLTASGRDGHPAAWRMLDGSLWFATLNGAVSVQPGSELPDRAPPAITIEQVLLDDQPVAIVPGAASLIIPPGHHLLAIHYAGLNFSAPSQVRYRYILQGFDSEWVEAKGRRTAYYTNVPPGSYKFLVSSANNIGAWNATPAQLNLTMRPFFYQTRWFYALLAALLLATAYAVYRWRVLFVESKYRAVLAERSRIAREIHDTLAQGYVAISVQLELCSRLLKTSREATAAQLEQTRELVRSNLAEARRSIWSLRSERGETLPSLLARLTKQQSNPEKAMVVLEVHGAYRPLPRLVETEVWRIAQEAVANASRHAGAASILVSLDYNSHTLQLKVSDDGVGFDNLPDGYDSFAARGHFGLKGMRERAAGLGAQLEVKSNSGEGTTVNLTIDMLQLSESERKSAQ